MELSLLLVEKIASMFLMMLFGFLLIKTRALKSSASMPLAKLGLFAICPCALIDALQIECTPERLSALALSFLAAIVVHIVYILIGHLLRRPLRLSKLEEASSIYSNASGLIIPLVIYCLGDEWAYCACGYIVVQTCLMWTHERIRLSGVSKIEPKQILLNTNIMAVIIGMAFFLLNYRLPPILGSTISDLGDMLGPMSMIILGMLLADVNWKQLIQYKRAFLVTALRLIVFPSLMVPIFAMLGHLAPHPDSVSILMVVLLSSASPVASTITQMAQIFDLDAGYAGVINIVGVLFCIITMPLIVAFYQILL